MKDIKGKQIFRRLLTAAVIILGLTYFSTLARTDYNDRSYSENNHGNFDRGYFYEIYKIGDSPHLYISIEHYKEKNGFTPVLISTGSLTIMKLMDRDGSVFDYLDIDNRDKEPLFMIDVNRGYILTGREAILCEITLQEKMRTRLRLIGENANSTVAVSKDNKEGELFLFNGRIKAARLSFINEEKGNNEPKVRILGPDIHTTERFLLEKESKILYSIKEYNHVKEMKERTQKRLSETPANSGESIPLTERQALIALYISTNGDNWKRNSGWKTPPLEADGFAAYGSEGTWYGITVESGHVTRISLYFNRLSGIIPPELVNLSNLSYLSLNENFLSGLVPPELGNLSNLQNLWLGWNSLSGNIPPQLGNLCTLKFLSLDFNNLSGSIPPELGNLSNLEYLCLDYNNLTGYIPPELGDLNNLYLFSLWDNSLTGSIPLELANLSKLKGLYLSNNNLTGSIPKELVNINSLMDLELSTNSLTGNIPPELGNFSNLYILNLWNNALSGSIPSELGNLNTLWYLGLSNNHLSGSIPQELGSLNNLDILRLQDNNLSGNIPMELGNLENLTSLFIGGNRISGEIPTSLSNLTGLVYVSVGYNALYTNDSTLITFLNNKDPDWAETQTIAPTGVYASFVNPTSIRVSWTPIRYTDDPGGYEVHIGTTRPYTLYGTTANKSVSSMPVIGLVPGTTYYFALRAVTYPHSGNKNTVTSKFSSISGYTLPSITITSPNGGEYWTLNTTHKITWTSTGLSNNLHIALVQSGEKVALIARDINPSPGSYPWKVGDCLRGTVALGTNYKILIKEKGTKVQDRSDTSFSISEPFLTVTAPNGGENWTLNTARNITWLASGLSNKINIIVAQNGTKAALIARNINPNRGAYTWKVGECLLGSVSAGTNYKILIKEKNSTVKDRSDNSFSISEPSITVTSPNGGENWTIGSPRDITWHAAGITGNLKITLWKEGIRIGVIANNINPNPSSLTWTAEQHSGGTTTPGNGYTIKIKEKDSPVSDSSNAAFTLTK